MSVAHKIKNISRISFGILLCFNLNLSAQASSQTLPQSAADKTSAFFSEGRTISANPTDINISVGTGVLQTYLEKKLSIQNDHGLHIGGMLSGDINDLFSGGIPHADRWTNNGLFVLDLGLDTEKAFGLKGGLFDVQFLQFNGQDTNGQAGSVQGYNGLPGAPPLNRTQLYQLWYRQVLFDEKLVIRVGKSVPTYDFANVTKPIPLESNHPSIDSITGLIYTPIFVNPTTLGAMPGYYNSAYGVTVSFAPIKRWYLSAGSFDGNLAQGKQTGLTGPNFNGNYFTVAETGADWLLGKNGLPGNIGVGAWHQSGLVENVANQIEHGTSGYYAFATQRLWYRNPLQDSSGITSFYQYGKNNSNVLEMTKYIGAGLTAFGLMPYRPDDSMGLGVSYAWLNQNIYVRQHDLMYQIYYQAQIIKQIFYLEPALTYIPTPGAEPNLNAAWAISLRAILVF